MKTYYDKPISPTTHLKSLPRFGGCPRKTWYKLYERVKKNPTDTEGSDTGTLTHVVLEKWLNSLKWGYERNFESILSDLVVSEFKKMKISEVMMDSVIEYAEEAKKQLQMIGPIKLLYDPEVTFVFPWFSRNGTLCNVKGKIDLLFSCPDEDNPDENRLCIADFKTGQLSYEREDGQPQFSTYVWLYEQLYKHHDHVPLPDWVYILGLRDRKIMKVPVDDSYTSDIESYIEEYLEFISSKDKKDYPSIESGLCKRHCEFSGVCKGIVMGRKT